MPCNGKLALAEFTGHCERNRGMKKNGHDGENRAESV
jgi:hypothetical protein